MDLKKKKYLKYKNKYLELKKSFIGGGNILDSTVNSFKINKETYENLEKKDKDNFPFYCPNDNQYMCTTSGPNYGLCKNNPEECSVYTGEQKYPKYDIESNSERIEMLNYGKQFGYNLHENKNCAKLTVDSQGEFDNTNLGSPEMSIQNNFKILTWNLWYSMKKTGNNIIDSFHLDFFNTRMCSVINNIILSNADIVCLQEVGELTFNQIYPSLKLIYPYYYEIPLNFNIDNNGERKRNLETVCLSKFPAKSFKLFGVEGNLNYNNSMLMIEYDKFIVFNVYLQAGTKNSPGQKDLWFNYSRCRYNEYMSIQKYINDNELSKPIIVLGDFNTNLNGDIRDWPELKAFGQMDLDDFWLLKYDNNSGFTEDTNINLMRWNVKFEEKIFRIDGIFGTKNKFNINQIELIGTEPIEINSELQKKFLEYRVPNIENKLDMIRKHENKIKLWPSDHFGVLAQLELKTN
jgi:exonuclease III